MKITDAQIDAMPPQERADLIHRLGGLAPGHLSDETGISPRRFRRIRNTRLAIMVSGTIILIPWIIYLAMTLPPQYEVRNWRLTWVGFDIILTSLMVSTVYFGMRRNRLVVPTAFATGVLLVCDTWFDVTTASPHDLKYSVLSAICVELPIAAVLILGTIRLMHLLSDPNTGRSVLAMGDPRRQRHPER